MKRLILFALLVPLIGCADDPPKPPDPCRSLLDGRYEACSQFLGEAPPSIEVCKKASSMLLDCRIAQQKREVTP